MANNIILADDDPIFRETTANYLRQLGFEVLLHESCDSVVEQVRERKPVACIIDMVMPGKEGMETMFELARMKDKPVLIGVSGTAQYLAALKDFIADATLLKPVSPGKLKKTLEELGVAP